MVEPWLTAILPYAVLAGISASVVSSLGLMISSFLRRRQGNTDLLPRLDALEKAIRRDTTQVGTQLVLAGHGLKPDMARSVVSDLSAIAGDLQNKASEMHRLLDEIRSDRGISDDIDNRKKIASLGLAVGQTEVSIEAVVRRIEEKRQELNKL